MSGWEKKIHVEGSLKPKEGQFQLFIGRWQPLHDAHRKMFQNVLDDGGKVCVAVRDVPNDYDNPFDSLRIAESISEEFSKYVAEGRFTTIIIPDIRSVEFGRGVGYSIVEHIPPPEVAMISATKIRENMRKNGEL